jgi:L-2-hydroxyglutarate oxidase LhgO
MSQKSEVTIIGAGVVGLAIAARVACEAREVYVLEKNQSFGMETSGRHSGVIHSGIYYPEHSLKAKLCVAGNRSLYELCEKYGIGHQRIGKLIVATNEEEAIELEHLLEQGRKNGAEGLSMLSGKEAKQLEPNVSAVAAILSLSTGIVDSHSLMKNFISRASAAGAQFAYQTEVVGIRKMPDGFNVTVRDDTGDFTFRTRVLINCAGLFCEKVAGLAGIDTVKAGYKLHYCKGEFYSLRNSKSVQVKRLIYPKPPPRLTGVGIHITMDLEGRMRLGPSSYYVDKLDYAVNETSKSLFYESVKRYLPSLAYDDIEPEMSGIRPKLQGPGDEIRDFVIREESDKGLAGLVNLIGIESPGLTASPAIADYVWGLIQKFF